MTSQEARLRRISAAWKAIIHHLHALSTRPETNPIIERIP